MAGDAREGPVQINQVQTFGAPRLPGAGDPDRIVIVNGHPPEVSLGKTHTPAFFKIDGGNDDH
jgi:hypothetical protein